VTALLSIRDLSLRYPLPGLQGLLGRRDTPAVDQVSLQVRPGEVVGLIGESGSGKTTLVRAAVGLLRFDSGHVTLLGQQLSELGAGRLRGMRRRCQLLLQNPNSSLNPGLSVEAHLRESAALHRPDEDPATVSLQAAERVGIAHRMDGHPHQLSGGEKRRVGIARLLIAEPLLTIADEPTAGLDAALKAELTDLLLATRSDQSGHLFISHDIPLIGYACDRVAVMYAGRLVEEVAVDELGRSPHHPYTCSLLAAAGYTIDGPQARSGKAAGRGSTGCPYQGPCPLASEDCARKRPALRRSADDNGTHRIACHQVGGAA